MSKHFSPMMSAVMNEAERGNKKTWVGYGDGHKCENCGDWGFFSLTVADAGPYNTPTQGKLSTISDKINGRTVWYSAKTMTFQCPDCQGGTRVNDGQFRPVARPVRELAEQWA